MKQDDFFAPRPKLSRQMRVIRTGALLAAVFISLGFFALEMLIVYWHFSPGVTTLNLSGFLVVILAQTALLLPCWRCWLLHRWACIATIMLFMLVPHFVLYAGWEEILILRSFGLFCSLVAVFMAACIGAEWRNLKSGF